VATQQEIGFPMTVDTKSMNDVAFSPDGKSSLPAAVTARRGSGVRPPKKK
jgi:hypothetical protein